MVGEGGAWNSALVPGVGDRWGGTREEAAVWGKGSGLHLDILVDIGIKTTSSRINMPLPFTAQRVFSLPHGHRKGSWFESSGNSRQICVGCSVRFFG